jgi:hypothetical protein
MWTRSSLHSHGSTSARTKAVCRVRSSEREYFHFGCPCVDISQLEDADLVIHG